jgi:hypothetical protein
MESVGLDKIGLSMTWYKPFISTVSINEKLGITTLSHIEFSELGYMSWAI